MRSNVVDLRPSSDLRPCDTEPAEMGLRVPTLTHDGRGWLARLLGRRPQPTTYQRCLAVHMHYAEPRSALK